MSLYLGPYVKVKVKYIEVDDIIYGCPNKECSSHNVPKFEKVNFCAKCGTAFEKYIKKGTKLFNPWLDVLQKSEFLDSLFEATSYGSLLVSGFHILASNKCGAIQPSLVVDLDREVEKDIRERDFNDEILLFQNKYHKELKLLKEEGFEFTFHCGIVIYF